MLSTDTTINDHKKARSTSAVYRPKYRRTSSCTSYLLAIACLANLHYKSTKVDDQFTRFDVEPFEHECFYGF